MVEGFLGRDDRKTTAYPGIREDFEGGSDDKSTRQTTFGKKSIVYSVCKECGSALPGVWAQRHTLLLERKTPYMSQEITEQAQDLAAQDNPQEIRSHDVQAKEQGEEEKEQMRTQLLREEKLVSGFTWIFLFVWIIGCAFLCRSAMSALVA